MVRERGAVLQILLSFVHRSLHHRSQTCPLSWEDLLSPTPSHSPQVASVFIQHLPLGISLPSTKLAGVF